MAMTSAIDPRPFVPPLAEVNKEVADEDDAF